MSSALSRDDIQRLLHALNEELKAKSVKAQVNLVGGAVMCLAFNARVSTRLDAMFEPAVEVVDAALKAAAREGVRDTWLNDAVEAYVSDRGSFETFLELSNLRVSMASADYMPAMKCLAMRVGEGHRDEENVRYLLWHLGIVHYEDAVKILERYYPLEGYPETALAAVQEILSESKGTTAER